MLKGRRVNKNDVGIRKKEWEDVEIESMGTRKERRAWNMERTGYQRWE